MEQGEDGAWELCCQDLGSRNGTFIVTNEDVEQLEPHVSHSIPHGDDTATFFRLGATDAAVCGRNATLLQVHRTFCQPLGEDSIHILHHTQDTASVSALLPAQPPSSHEPPADVPPPSPLRDLPPEQLAALASLLEAARSLNQADPGMARLPSLQEWAPDSDAMQRLPSLQEWARANSLGRGRCDRMPSVAEWGRLASALGVQGPDAARRLLADRAPSLTFHQPSAPQRGSTPASPVRNGGMRPMSPQQALQSPLLAPPMPVQIGRKRMATPEIVQAAETLMLRHAVRPRV